MSDDEKCQFCILSPELTLKIANKKYRLCSHCCVKFSEVLKKENSKSLELAVVVMDHYRCEECGFDWVLQLFKRYSVCLSCGSKKIVKYNKE